LIPREQGKHVVYFNESITQGQAKEMFEFNSHVGSVNMFNPLPSEADDMNVGAVLKHVVEKLNKYSNRSYFSEREGSEILHSDSIVTPIV